MQDKKSSFEAWLRETTNLGVDTEINVQLGEFTLKKHRVEPVDGRLCSFGDFAHIFGVHEATGFSGLQCAEVKNTKTAPGFASLVVGTICSCGFQTSDRYPIPFESVSFNPSSTESWILETIPLLEHAHASFKRME